MSNLNTEQQEQFDAIKSTPYYWEVHAKIYYGLIHSDHALTIADRRADAWFVHAIRNGFKLC